MTLFHLDIHRVTDSDGAGFFRAVIVQADTPHAVRVIGRGSTPGAAARIAVSEAQRNIIPHAFTPDLRRQIPAGMASLAAGINTLAAECLTLLDLSDAIDEFTVRFLDRFGTPASDELVNAFTALWLQQNSRGLPR